MKYNIKKKTILHLIETGGPGGAENVLISLACGLDKKKFHSIVCLRKEGWLYNELIRRGIETYVLKEDGLFDFTFVARLLSLIARKGWDKFGKDKRQAQ